MAEKTKRKRKDIDRKDCGLSVLFEPQIRRDRDLYGRRTCLRFLNDESEDMGTLELRQGSWKYFTPSADPDQTYGWHASQLRAIADKLDELNGE